MFVRIRAVLMAGASRPEFAEIGHRLQVAERPNATEFSA
jgi:hypothetical protein